jgi:general secretion pathway protein D
MRYPVPAAFALMLLSACQVEPPETVAPLPEPTASAPAGAAQPRVSGPVAETIPSPPATIDYGRRLTIAGPAAPAAPSEPGEFTVDFVDADIRQVASSILGSMLNVNYAIDPAVSGTATIKSAKPMTRAQLLGALQTALAQNAMTLSIENGIYRVLPIESAQGRGVAGAHGESAVAAGTEVVPLRYASARDLAKVLEPFVAEGGAIAADPGRNVVLVSGDGTARQALVELIRAFDVDLLAGRSYAIFPVTTGNEPDKVAQELQSVLMTEQGGSLADTTRIVAMPRINAVLAVSTQPRYIDHVRDLLALINEAKDATARSWHVYYVQNGQSSDLEYVLQRAFTPKHVTATAPAPGAIAPGLQPATLNGATSGQGETGGLPGADTGASSAMGAPYSDQGGQQGFADDTTQQQVPGQPQGQQASPATEPLSEPTAGSEAAAENDIRIIANRTNNALLIYSTPAEERMIEAMLAKIDIVPLQVRIDATIAEVTLNDNLRYGTQFFFKDGGLQGVLSNVETGAIGGAFPGFVLAQTSGAVRFALSALQAVTNVRVLSSPQVLVLDNQPARLQVGDLVPYVVQTSQSVTDTNAPIINSIAYRQTGVILLVVPRVNTGGLVSLDISQSVSDVRSTNTSNIDSPTFLERRVTSRVVVQDGQTIGLAGLIRDNTSEGNSGVPILKDIPIIGSLFGTQDNTRTRTELLVLITPHVVHDQRDARALTDDLRETLRNAALVPQQLQVKPPSGFANPNAPYAPNYTQ